MEKVNGPVTDNIFQPRETVRLGLIGSAEAYRNALMIAGRSIGSWADDILSKCPFTAEKKSVEVDLVVASVAELGFPEGARYSDICERAVKRGLELCRAEVGPALCLAYKGHLCGDALIIAMEALWDSNGDLVVFYLIRRDEMLSLVGSGGRPGGYWPSKTRFVFAMRN
ncbi:hypothetical protein [Bradyrhizobium japonicum]|uniref:hypothetical protein n=1 Tax=Bradyrhizobium japonicum TaxID=375 RepID=UPI00048668CB|nr:hypothetical protein [Bradyrhizobium japonicum]WLB87706.1 hypothetical protein QIH91_34085 [Bradyrhizobium japonicum USDA 135]